MAREVSKEYIMHKINEHLNNDVVYHKEMNEFWCALIFSGCIVSAFVWGTAVIAYPEQSIRCDVGGDELYKRLSAVKVREVKHEQSVR